MQLFCFLISLLDFVYILTRLRVPDRQVKNLVLFLKCLSSTTEPSVRTISSRLYLISVHGIITQLLEICAHQRLLSWTEIWIVESNGEQQTHLCWKCAIQDSTIVPFVVTACWMTFFMFCIFYMNWTEWKAGWSDLCFVHYPTGCSHWNIKYYGYEGLDMVKNNTHTVRLNCTLYSIKVPKLCQKQIHTTYHQPEPLIQGQMDPRFCVLMFFWAIFW